MVTMSKQPENPSLESSASTDTTATNHSNDPKDHGALPSLQLPKQAEILDVVDRVRALGIEYDIPLPVLIVVGDQSSGKSSVLEAISGVKFPIGQGTSTRFATEIILRHSEEISASVIIQPSSERSEDQIQRLRRFNRSGSTLADVPDLIQEAHDVMEVGDGFSRDILRLSISGPKCLHLTLVDLPGLIRNPKKAEDRDIVYGLVKEYMSNPRSIILAVVRADGEYETQEILNLARLADPQGKRTMGIVTRPDTAVAGSKSVTQYISCAKGEYQDPLRLGWHIVRNLEFNQRGTGVDRDQTEEEFLSKSPWNQIMPDRRGIRSLRTRLSQVLQDHIREVMPSVTREIQQAMSLNDGILKKLDDPRPDLPTKRQYLTKIAEKYYRLVLDSVNGYYKDDFFESFGENARLRKKVQDLNDVFAAEMRESGHLYEILWKEDLPLGENPRVQQLADEMLNSPLMQLVSENLKKERGWEMPGNFNPIIIGSILKEMTKKWLEIAKQHADSVWGETEIYLEVLLRHICPEQEVHDALWNNIIEEELGRRLDAVHSKIDEIASPYTKGQPYTYSSRVHMTTPHIAWILQSGSDRLQVENIQAGITIFSQAQAHYQIALEIFVDNVAFLGVENTIINGLEDILSSARVSLLSDKELSEIASENPETVLRRRQIYKQKEDLEIALKLCKRYERAGFGRRSEGQNTRYPGGDSSSLKTAMPQKQSSQQVQDGPLNPDKIPLRTATSSNSSSRSNRDGATTPTTNLDVLSSASSYNKDQAIRG